MLPKKWDLLLFLTSIIALFYCAHSAGSYKENEVINQAADCLCGKNEECKFENGEKICTCIDGYSKNNDSECQACNCGDGSRGCSFKDGVKSCYCRFKYVEKDGVCEACNCGEGSWYCSLKDKEKICHCQITHASKDSTCVACNCGNASKGCSFKDGEKICNCYPEQADNEGVCENCDCGLFASKCYFKDGIKTCECFKGHSHKNGSCESCECGNGTCFFKEDRKSCICYPGFVESYGYCKANAIAADNKTGAIAGGVLGTLLVINILIVAFILYRRYQKTTNYENDSTRNRQGIALPEIFGGRKQQS